jgi:hypothetical protein
MAIVMHRWVGLKSIGNFVGSATLNFPPSPAFAQASLNFTLGGGTQKVGIVSFRFRKPDGSDGQVDFGGWTSWPSTTGHERMTSVTFGVATGSNQQLDGIGNVFFWG